MDPGPIAFSPLPLTLSNRNVRSGPFGVLTAKSEPQNGGGALYNAPSKSVTSATKLGGLCGVAEGSALTQLHEPGASCGELFGRERCLVDCSVILSCDDQIVG